MTTKTRLYYLLIASLSACMVYVLGGKLQGEAWIVPASFEDLIPFNPAGIWMYLMFYVYVPFTFLKVHESNVRPMCFAFVCSAVISGIVFIVFPSTMLYPDFKTEGLSGSLLYFVSENDTEQNCFPSLHAALITICTIANWKGYSKLQSWAYVLLTLFMYYAIIQVRRHVFLDLAAGIVLAFIGWLPGSYMFKDGKGNHNRNVG